jgi:GDP/UDP-N,N'-diacetylbacillosamine 2-epimerase (hydrolysing)
MPPTVEKGKRKILGVTGIRSDYDIMSSVFQAVNEHPDLDLRLIVTGAHLSDAYGKTISEIRADGFSIVDEVESLLNADSDASRVKSLAIQLQGLVQAFQRERPHFLLVLGDREEAMTTALAGAYMNIPVAHVGGGDRVIGNVDDQVRHAVTKLAHVHFVSNEESYQRVLQLGEQPFRVFNVGNPGLDRFLSVPKLTAADVSRRLGFEIGDDEKLILVIQHVISTEIDQAYSQMKTTLEAVRQLGIKTILSYPNSDAGSQQMIKAIQEYEGRLPFLYTAKSIPRLEFVNIMRRADCMLGNSSAGILEAPLLKLPVVNIGNRQIGRLHAENVQFVKHVVSEICAAVKRSLFDVDYRKVVSTCKNPYGNGQASKKISDKLASIDIDEKLLIKDITF